jgi:hypothetical protein
VVFSNLWRRGWRNGVCKRERELFAKRERVKLGPAPAGKCCVAINLDLSNVLGAIEEDEFGSCLRL